MRSLLDWLTDTFRGPRCPYGCGHRARNEHDRALHQVIEHCGDHP